MPGGATTCDSRTYNDVPSPRGVHPIQTQADLAVFPRTPAAKAAVPDYASSERAGQRFDCGSQRLDCGMGQSSDNTDY
jgi:hypothetical protein